VAEQGTWAQPCATQGTPVYQSPRWLPEQGAEGGFTRTSFVECCFMKYVQFARALQEADSSLPVDFSEHQIHGPDNSNCIGQQMSSTELVHGA
jgi:hypothetical protein